MVFDTDAARGAADIVFTEPGLSMPSANLILSFIVSGITPSVINIPNNSKTVRYAFISSLQPAAILPLAASILKRDTLYFSWRCAIQRMR